MGPLRNPQRQQPLPTSSTITSQPSPKDKTLNLSRPRLMGFEMSRPGSFFSLGLADIEVTRNIYRHPDRQGHPSQPLNKFSDIYALGVVLLEIGLFPLFGLGFTWKNTLTYNTSAELWQPAISLNRVGIAHVREPKSIQKDQAKNAEKRLGSKMSEKYRARVVKCLAGSFRVTNDTKEDPKLQQAFGSEVVEVSQKAAEYA